MFIIGPGNVVDGVGYAVRGRGDITRADLAEGLIGLNALKVVSFAERVIGQLDADVDAVIAAIFVIKVAGDDAGIAVKGHFPPGAVAVGRDAAEIDVGARIRYGFSVNVHLNRDSRAIEFLTRLVRARARLGLRILAEEDVNPSNVLNAHVKLAARDGADKLLAVYLGIELYALNVIRLHALVAPFIVVANFCYIDIYIEYRIIFVIAMPLV